MTCQRPGTAWQNVWMRPPGSSTGLSVAAKTTPEVPIVALTAPARTMPMPTAPAAWSPPPATMGVPALRPVASAPLSDTLPVTIGDSKASGISDGERSSAVSTVSDHLRAPTSKSSVPEASATSVAFCPLSRKRT